MDTPEKTRYMLKRKIQDKLAKWYESDHKKALLLTGARQVGKTTSIRSFAESHYSNIVEVNFVKNPEAKLAFDGSLDTRTIRANLTAMGYGPFIEHQTLVFLDEIQECPNARTAIKFLVEDGLFDYVESGSLLGINYKHVPSYPVGYEEEIELYPMDFEEFLWARNIPEETISILHDSFHSLQAVPEFIHQQISKYYREYLVVGGMPEAVQRFVDTSDMQQTLRVQKSILTSYRSDISNYAGRQQTLVRRIFNAIPSELGKQDKRFILADIEKGASRRKYEDPTQWLIDAGIAYYSFNTKSLTIPLEAVENRSLYKLYLVDTGLLCATLLRGIQFQVLNGDLTVNEGALTENFIACQLKASGYDLHYYDKKSKQELDFVIVRNDQLTLIEVKSGNDYHRHASLDAALREHNNQSIKAFVFCKGNIEAADNICYLPLYMALFLGDD